MKAILDLFVVGVLCSIAQSQQFLSEVYPDSSVIFAASHGELDKLKTLLENGEKVDTTDSNLWTPLFHAVKQNNEDMVKLVINHKADINFKERLHGFTPLHLAVHNNFGRIAGRLMENNADVNSVSSAGDSILHTASEKGDEEIVNLLILLGANVNETNSDQQTPLHRAAAMDHVSVAGLLIKAGANVNEADQKDSTPLYLAITHGSSPSMLELLIQHGADVNRADETGKTPLHKAVHLANVKYTELLIANGADVNAKDNDLNSPLHISAKGSSNEHYAITELLVNNDANVFAENAEDQVPLDLVKTDRRKDDNYF